MTTGTEDPVLKVGQEKMGSRVIGEGVAVAGAEEVTVGADLGMEAFRAENGGGVNGYLKAQGEGEGEGEATVEGEVEVAIEYGYLMQ